MSRQSSRNGSNSRAVGQTDVARSHKDANGGLATLEPATDLPPGTPVDPLLRATEFITSREEQERQLGHDLMGEYKNTRQRLDQIGETLTRLGMTVPGTVEAPRRGRKKGSKNRVKAEATVSDGEPVEVKAGSNSAIVLALVQKFAPGKMKAKTKLQLKELAAKDPKFKNLSDVSLNTGLQANRPPKVKVPRIGLKPNANGNPRGGKYYALV